MPHHLSGETRLFPIIGDPIIYVQSPDRLTRALAAVGQNGICIPMQVAETDFASVMAGLTRTNNVDGILVTMPHKFTARGSCTTLSSRSALLGVVSVMRRNPDGTWHGDMLDGLAFLKAQKEQGAAFQQARVLLLGAGGAGRAIALALMAEGLRELVIFDSSTEKAAELVALAAEAGAGKILVGSPDPLGFDVICNATPIGMGLGDPLPLDVTFLQPTTFVGDVISGHGETPLLRAARSRGCKTTSGDQMVEAVQTMMLDFLLHR
ncbi:MAG: shikimate dehydrogenase [Pseudorhodobacter sp. PARRP1]|nr:MAG: shikimate dehydrogenase [Pseudorhodobacter sp. PARRP1]